MDEMRSFRSAPRALKKGAARFATAAPKKATGGVTPVADNYQKSVAGLFL
jgi:hypothetical protein